MAASSEPSTKEWVQSLVEPGMLLFWAMSYYARVNFETVFQRRQLLAPLLQTSKLRDEAFGRFWVAFSTTRADGPPPPVADAPASGQIQCSSDLIPPILARASGVVLDVGPGTGTQMPLLRSPAIKAIYGAEPCAGLHAELRARAEAEGLADKYHIVPTSVVAAELVPALEARGLSVAGSGSGVFDTIVCVRVLCSVPDMRRTVAELYGLLRPGGRLLVVEHVVNPWRTPKGSLVARVMQAVYGWLGWSWFVGDCCLNRDTEAALRAAAAADGGWEEVEVDRWFGRSPLPYVSGVLVKRG
ncbi:S-adenosyl-L-methionine-dependent methyltransferase [Aspergillus ambiguus]|uniref:class I SAM-dependent methyltransferase n=1 Tax=Aspergillus ambiguus TaxID=176160 RepID=UPI003CCD6628